MMSHQNLVSRICSIILLYTLCRVAQMACLSHFQSRRNGKQPKHGDFWMLEISEQQQLKDHYSGQDGNTKQQYAICLHKTSFLFFFFLDEIFNAAIKTKLPSVQQLRMTNDRNYYLLEKNTIHIIFGQSLLQFVSKE